MLLELDVVVLVVVGEFLVVFVFFLELVGVCDIGFQGGDFGVVVE